MRILRLSLSYTACLFMQGLFEWGKAHPETQRTRDLQLSTQDIRNLSEKHLPNPHRLDKNEVC